MLAGFTYTLLWITEEKKRGEERKEKKRKKRLFPKVRTAWHVTFAKVEILRGHLSTSMLNFSKHSRDLYRFLHNGYKRQFIVVYILLQQVFALRVLSYWIINNFSEVNKFGLVDRGICTWVLTFCNPFSVI